MSVPSDDRWSIDELVTRYLLEPGMADVFVEGQFDRDVLRRCFDDSDERDRVAYPVEVVSIPPDTLHAHRLTPGRKQEVIALARELATLADPRAYRCLVDRDLDHWFGALEKTPRLVWTRYSSLDLYFYSTKTMKDLFQVAAKCAIPNWTKLEDSLGNVLTALYAFRLADRDLGFSLRWVSFDRCLSVAKGEIVLAEDDYVKRLLAKNGKTSEKTKFVATVSKWKQSIPSDRRLFIRGHDFVELVGWAIRKFGGLKEFQSPEAIERLLVLLSNGQCEIVEDLRVA